MAKPLVIVESPAKARTIAKFLGSDYVVESSIGHIRDLPRAASEIPAAYKGEAWARLGVDTDNDFKPLYVVAKEKKEQVRKLKDLLKDADELYLATDEDREGESIAWHLLEVLSPRVPVKRMVFHEITETAIREAIASTRDLDRRLVDAQETRRILDRLYGYEISPVLWRKILPKLSAGRVQSVACRVIVDRERARMAFSEATYYDLVARLKKADETFTARLISVDGRKVAGSKDFHSSGQLEEKAKRAETLVIDETLANGLVSALVGANFTVQSTETKPYRRSPAPPFMTSTLQQEAGRKLRFSSQRTMSVAQRLYENGFITYMRTDSIALSESAVNSARSIAQQLFGDGYTPDMPRRYRSKVKNAQEAHEAIRPSGESWRSPEEVQRELAGDEARLYELIWKRAVASQMSDALGSTMNVKVGTNLVETTEPLQGISGSGAECVFSASGRVISFPGFLRVYVEDFDDDAGEGDEDARLPAMREGDHLHSDEMNADRHQTQPPPRYTEASLVKTLEELGVGRPSTYASIISTILDRGYAWKKGQALVPSFLAFAVVRLLEGHFSELVDYSFTAEMENDLDRIASGTVDQIPYLSEFYFGAHQGGLKPMVETKLGEIDAREISTIRIGETSGGVDVVVRVGKYGPFVQVGEATASIPDDLAPDEVTVEKAEELVEKAAGADRIIGLDPVSGAEIFVKAGRYGPYVQVGELVEGSKDKPRTASLMSYMDPASITLEDALLVLSLPRVVGVDPVTHEEIYAQGGRFGPYLSRGKDTRSLASESEIFEVTVEQALALFSAPKTRGRRGASSASAGAEVGVDPVSGRMISLKSGRFGPYVTDGEVNASLRRGMNPDELVIEEAIDLLAERRAKIASGAPVKSTKTSKKRPGARAPKS
jgi:DNA topoisomerase-1